MIKPVSKLPNVGTTIFTVMSKMAADHQAINLSQGFPDFDVPPALVERLHHYATNGANQYPPMQGIPYLCEQIAAKTQACHRIAVDAATEITMTSGATEALFVAIHALVSTGDEVIVFDPAYDCYDPAIRLAGGKAVHIPLSGPDFAIDWAQVAAKISKRTRAILINSPHNPTGAVLLQSDLDQLAALVDGTPIVVISDEVYEHMVFDDAQHSTVLGHPALRDRSIMVSSFGKTFHATGWKIGYAIAAPALTVEFRKIHQFVTFTTHTPSQWAIADFLEHHPEHYEGLPVFYAAKRDLFYDAMADIGFAMTPSPGTYFQLADYSGLSDEPDTVFVERLTREAGVAAIPVSVFFETPPRSRHIRFCFAKRDATLLAAAQQLRAFFA